MYNSNLFKLHQLLMNKYYIKLNRSPNKDRFLKYNLYKLTYYYTFLHNEIIIVSIQYILTVWNYDGL